MNETQQTIYLHGKLLLSIVQNGVAESLVNQTKLAGARGGTILVGKGVADHAILHMLGIGDSHKEIVLTLLTEEQTEPVWKNLSMFRKNKRLSCGIAMLIDVPHLLRHSSPSVQNRENPDDDQRRKIMDSPHTLITCIVNKGTADEVMDAARKAGATGGTIMAARGTGKEEDVKFFGVQLVPEKEILLILVGSGLTGKVLDAIRSVPCLAEPGSGIAFCTDVDRFMTLGGKD
ncbi:P-II family nitrogen regulator [Pleomorphochaeta sp. DL1XJH-081]|uniref:P-II family nitrogen regulator n=1 Tax=Pleomorphochaeta sp. DL1XJH-081 TaxID=3409690 RepID=UPI003BB48CD0